MLVIKAGVLIDGKGGEPQRDVAVLVEEGRIAAVGRAHELQVPAGAQVVEAPGGTLLPGLIDCHVHIMSHSPRVQDQLATPTTVALFLAAKSLRATLRAGFTTIRDAGGAEPGLRRAIELGLVEGPRLLVAGAIGQTGTHMQAYYPSGVTLQHSAIAPAWIADGVDEVRKATREALRNGFDLIKICATGGVMSPQDSPDYTEFTVEEIRAIVEAAAQRGTVVMAHVEGAQGIKNAVLGGVWSVEHCTLLDDEALDLILSRDVFYVPTLLLPQYIVDHGREQGMGEYALAKADRVQKTHVASYRKGIAAGAKFALGTDAMGELHGKNAHELTLMVADGLSPMQAIVAATKTAAAACRLDDKVGTIEAGKLADLVLVDGDPLADISILEQQERLTVFKEGVKVGA